MADDAHLLDTSDLGVEEAIAEAIAAVEQRKARF
jgi:cytidylate kinase